MEIEAEDDGLKAVGNVIRIDQEHVRDHIDRVVRSSVEETINALLDAEAKQLCNVGSLQAAVAYEGGPCDVEDAEASRAGTRYGDH